MELSGFSLTITDYDVSTSYSLPGADEAEVASVDRCNVPLIEISDAYTKAADPPVDEVERQAFECIRDGGGDPGTLFSEDGVATDDDGLVGECYETAKREILGTE